MRLDINCKGKYIRNTNTWRLNNTFLNNQQVTEEIKKGNEKTSRNKWQWKHDNSKSMEGSKSHPKREVYSNTILPQETKKNHQIDNLTLLLKQLEKEQKTHKN